MPEIPEAYRAAVLEQQRELAKLVKSAGLEPVKRLYEQMMTDVARRIRRVGSGSMTHMQARGILAQIKLGLARIMQAVNGKVGQAAVEVGIASARQMLEDVARLERHFTGAFIELPVLEVATLHGIVHEQASSLMRIHETSLARYGVRLVERMEGSLAASIASGETHGEAADGIIKIAGLEWRAAERIVRTELSYVANASSRAAADEQADELDGDLWTRWSEHVTDGGVAMDDRVGDDSLALHGQVAPPGGMFTQPPTAPRGQKVEESLVGKTFAHPPSRPNDRAVLVPWRAHWGVPGWIWKGRRVYVTQRMAASMNARRAA